MISHRSDYKLGSKIIDVYLQINPFNMNKSQISIIGLISTTLKLIQAVCFGQVSQYLVLIICLYEITNP